MSTYELDDAAVRAYLDDDNPVRSEVEAVIVRALSEQVPTPVPTKIGAVVRTTEPNYVYIRWALDETDHRPWVDPQDGERRTTERLGRITAILSEGVDQ